MNQERDNISEVFRTGFEGYTVAPSKSLWASIKHKLWLQSFVKFSVGSFNIYYAASMLLATIVGSVVTVNHISDSTPTSIANDTVGQVEKQEIPSWVRTKDNYYPHTYYPETKDETTGSDIGPKPLKQKNASMSLPQDLPVRNKCISPITIQDEAKNLKEGHQFASKTDHESESGIQSKLENHGSVSSIDKDIKEKANSLIDSEEIENPFGEKENTSEERQLAQSSKEKETTVAETQESLIEESPLEENITVYDTILVYDTLVHYDTVSVHKPFKNRRFNFSVDVFAGANTSTFNYGHDVESFEDSLNNFTSGSGAYQAGVTFNISHKRWELSTGIAYYEFEEDFGYDHEYAENNPIMVETYVEIEPLHTIDTINYEFVFNSVDSSFVSAPVIHETWISQYDTVQEEIPSWTYETKNYDNLNKYTYLNIPIHIGYKFYDRNRISFLARAGADVGIFLNAKGKGFSLSDRTAIVQMDESDLPFAKTNIAWRIGMAAHYRFDERLTLSMEPWYRAGTQSIYKSSHPVSTKIGAMGINLGLRFHL